MTDLRALNLPIKQPRGGFLGEYEGLGALAAALEDKLVEVGVHGDGIFAVEAGHAELVLVPAARADHAGGVEVAEGIGLEILGDFLVGKLVGDQVLGIGKVDAVVARVPVRGTADADVDFLGPGLAQVHDPRPRRGAAHDGIVDDDHPFAGHARLDDVQLHLHAEFTGELRRIEEGAPDIVVADKRRIVRNARFLAVAERRVVAGVGHGNDEIGLDRMETGEFASHVRPHLADVDAFQHAVGPGEVDVLEDTETEAILGNERLERAEAILINDHDLAGGDIADELGAGDDIEGAAFAGEEPGIAHFADAKGTETEGIAHADDFPFAQKHERKGSFNLTESLNQAAIARIVRALGHEVEDDLAIDGGFENRALGFEFIAKQVRIHEISVVTHGDLAAGTVDYDGLGVFQRARAGRGIADMADGAGAGKLGQAMLVENLGDESHPVMALEFTVFVPGDDDTRALLPAMLQGVEPEKGDFGRVGVPVDGENATFVLGTVLKNGVSRQGMVHAHVTYTPSAPKEKSFDPFRHIFAIKCVWRARLPAGAGPSMDGYV